VHVQRRLRPLEHLGRFDRKATPLPLCRWLVDRVRERFQVEKVAVLWVERRSHYWRLWPEVELWGKGRDARTYAGPHPVICHPPCGPWGNYKAKALESREDGLIAMEMVHRWGGVIEHPVGSCLFRDHGRGGTIERIDQADFGHQARKATLLYWTG
jgi:hypothetical protein